MSLFDCNALFGHLLLVEVDLGLDYIEVNGELLKHEGRAHCVHFYHEGERHDIEHISLIQLTVLKHVGEEVVFSAYFPVVLEVIHHLFLVRVIRHPLELDALADRRPFEMEECVEVMGLNPVCISSG